MSTRSITALSSLLLLECLTHGAAVARASAPAALSILIDASSATTAATSASLPMVVNALQGAVSSRDDLSVGVRLYGTKQDAGAPDCTDSLLAVPFAPLRPESVELLRFAPEGRRVAGLANALEAAGGDLASCKGARSRHLIVIAGSGDGCGGDPCAAAARLAARGVDIAAVLLLTASKETERELSCVGPTIVAREPAGLGRALSELLLDSGAGTGLSVAHYDAPGDLGHVRFSVTPAEPSARTGLDSARSPGDVVGLEPGAYTLAFEDSSLPPRRIEIAPGKVTPIVTGRGSVTLSVENYYGEPLDASVEVRAVAGDSASERFLQDLSSRARAADRRVPHSTLPVVKPQPLTPPPRFDQTPATTRPATAPSTTRPTTQPAVAATQPATATGGATEETTLAAGVLALGTSGESIPLDAGRYDLVVNRDGATLRVHDVAIEPGKATRLSVRFGALKLVGRRAPVEVRTARGDLVAVARTQATVHLPAGRYLIAGVGEARVREGDMTLIE